MKKGVYVCYRDYGYDGYSEPKAIFKKEVDAKRWCKVNPDADYELLEIQSKFTAKGDGKE